MPDCTAAPRSVTFWNCLASVRASPTRRLPLGNQALMNGILGVRDLLGGLPKGFGRDQAEAAKSNGDACDHLPTGGMTCRRVQNAGAAHDFPPRRCEIYCFEPCGHGTTELKYVQDNILLESRMPFEGYFRAARSGERCLIQRDTAVRLKEDCAERPKALQARSMDLTVCLSNRSWRGRG